MAWPTKTQFQAVERLPVPPEVNAAFKKIESAHVGQGYAKGLENRMKAAAKVESATTEAAAHFGGDVGKTMTHFKRWQRWGKTMMSPAGLVEDFASKVAYDKNQSDFARDAAKDSQAEDAFAKGKRLTKPRRTTA